MSEKRSLRVALSGATGRMGRTVAARMATHPDLDLVGCIARTPHEEGVLGRIATPDHSDPFLEACDVLIDFSAPAFLLEVLERNADALRGKALVTGTTGLDAPAEARLDDLAHHTAVLSASNFSPGVNLLIALAERAARALPADAYDVEVIEVHHRGKADAPSGTALALGDAVARGRGQRLGDVRVDGRSGRSTTRPIGDVAFHSVRGGAVIGEHRVLFLGAHERIQLTHAAEDRALFAEGALAAARWLAGRPPGRYTMAQVIGL